MKKKYGFDEFYASVEKKRDKTRKAFLKKTGKALKKVSRVRFQVPKSKKIDLAGRSKIQAFESPLSFKNPLQEVKDDFNKKKKLQW